MSEKLFSVAGTSKLNGKVAVRVANNINRAKVLARNGHTDVKLEVLPKAMNKADATAYVLRGNAPSTDAWRNAQGQFTKQAFVVTSVELAA